MLLDGAAASELRLWPSISGLGLLE